MTDRTKAERAIAFLVHELRNEWDEHGITVVLRKVSEKPLPDVIAAALDCATRRHDQRTPACIALDGEHWRALTNMAGGGIAPVLATYLPPTSAEIACRVHLDRQPCKGCAADRKAEQQDEIVPALDRLPGETVAAWAKRIKEAEAADVADIEQEQEWASR